MAQRYVRLFWDGLRSRFFETRSRSRGLWPSAGAGRFRRCWSDGSRIVKERTAGLSAGHGLIRDVGLFAYLQPWISLLFKTPCSVIGQINMVSVPTFKKSP